jgi:hypothetical protein
MCLVRLLCERLLARARATQWTQTLAGARARAPALEELSPAELLVVEPPSAAELLRDELRARLCARACAAVRALVVCGCVPASNAADGRTTDALRLEVDCDELGLSACATAAVAHAVELGLGERGPSAWSTVLDLAAIVLVAAQFCCDDACEPGAPTVGVLVRALCTPEQWQLAQQNGSAVLRAVYQRVVALVSARPMWSWMTDTACAATDAAAGAPEPAAQARETHAVVHFFHRAIVLDPGTWRVARRLHALGERDAIVWALARATARVGAPARVDARARALLAAVRAFCANGRPGVEARPGAYADARRGVGARVSDHRLAALARTMR